ncbi:DUF5682 family protein [Fulvivirga maritima]|uniref:DUF5682 family protein n=1 Tax=Fulvivirga maritima TaxID=2904247 RepID=UPI001F38AC3E|nr:DUF5682 family protein [Fulvivirga maritima]UII28763.1 DUF5682 family protein [Fulvivirga maritima]
MAIHVLGIRHHGVGSARQVKKELERLQPDIVLVEGPPEIAEVFEYVGHPDLKPPVAIMVYNSNVPQESTFYPFAEYSPEWVAIAYANEHKIPVKAIDLPASISFTMRRKEAKNEPSTPPPEDPLTLVAQSAGFKSGERFWEHHFEQSAGNEHFESVMHVMQSLREDGLESAMDAENTHREAYMRMLIQDSVNEMYTNIAIVCGAWHAPTLVDPAGYAKEDKKVLKKLPKTKTKITSTWIPWTNDRLSMHSGYGAGIFSPGWYSHLWHNTAEYEIPWLIKVASMFREKGMDMSTAHAIEAFRLARSLAILRNNHYVSLDDLNDAVLSVMCMGDGILLELVKDQLIIGDGLGEVPEDMPKMPLQEDFEQSVKKLRLKLTADPKEVNLDLRKPNDLEKSKLFHRLAILEIHWATPSYSRGKGTFKESWRLEWTVGMMIELIDKAFLGNTIASAAQAVLIKKSNAAQKVDDVAKLIDLCIPAALFDELDHLLNKVNELSSISSDILDLMKSLPQLINVARYGDVRNSDMDVLDQIIHQLLIKVNVGLPNAVYGLDEDNALEMFGQITALHQAIKIYSKPEEEEPWYFTLHQVLNKEDVHSVILGCVCRLLLDSQQLSEDEADMYISYALSVNNDPMDVAAWIEGFLKGSGSILIYDNRLWNLVFEWVESLDKDTFIQLVPMLRRTFSKFEYAERRQLGQKARQGLASDEPATTYNTEQFDGELADSVIPYISKFLTPNSTHHE